MLLIICCTELTKIIKIHFAMTSETVGKRICVDGFFGTVKFAGAVPPTKGGWLGVDWDDPTRGKHNGIKDGVQYFTCAHATSGSFVRPQKVNFGKSICEAVKDRYTSSGDSSYNIDIYFGSKKTEAVGLDKVQKSFEKLDSLQELGLRGQLISSSSSSEGLGKLTPNVKNLNISQNLISNWSTVYLIISELPLLKYLSISENRIIADTIDGSYQNIPSNVVETLIANKCGLQWSDVMQCCESLPYLKKLVVTANFISCISEPLKNSFSLLQTLDLSENKSLLWDEVKNLKNLPQLSELLLIDCGLEHMPIAIGDFSTLKSLFISKNKFQGYAVFNELDKLISLEELHARNLPVFLEEKNYETAEGIIIAKIGNLKMINRSSIDPLHRQSAELDYLRVYGAEWRKEGGHQDPSLNKPSSNFLENHPRYLKMINKYGALEDHQIIKKSTALKNNLVEVVIDAKLVKPDCKLISKKLPLTMKVGNLKLLLRRLTKVDIRDQRLFYVSKENPDHEVQMDKDDETLHDISIEPGDIIQIRNRYTD